MKTALLKVSIRNQALLIPKDQLLREDALLNETTSALLANVKSLGFTFSEPLLRALNGTHPQYKLDIFEVLQEVTGIKKNWTPLVKGWNVPTGESVVDHLVTLWANLFGNKKGTTLPCGHLIPDKTFPLERYNGCPFCGTPFEFGALKLQVQGSKLKVLDLWTEADAHQYLQDLLASKTALDATQVDSLKMLLQVLPVSPDTGISMKETLMLVIDTLLEQGRDADAGQWFKTPADILRYLWYKHTGFLQILEPKTIARRKSNNHAHLRRSLDRSGLALFQARNGLKLKYSRAECRRVAQWLNALPLSTEKACEIMHPKRQMWVRFIRALRLAEYGKRKDFEYLAALLDMFYHGTYDVWQGRIEHHRLRCDPEKAFALLKKRPGLFARSLFSNMLWFGADTTLEHFREVTGEVHARLLLTLNMYAGYYFDPQQQRTVRPLGGTAKRIGANKLLQIYPEADLKKMPVLVGELCLDVMGRRFAAMPTGHQTIYIAPELHYMPLAIGERSETVQDLPSALMGTRFPLQGHKLRLFMQWGEGLPAQHLDMDLSCKVAYENAVDICSFGRLTTLGCQHSGDIRSIPHKVGTAEYIELDVAVLRKAGAKYVSFTCNAYSRGDLSPNLVVGWMDSKNRMRISEKTGVAYDPSCVQHQVRITRALSKGLVFGVLDVAANEIIWLEMPFGGQVVQTLSCHTVEALLQKLNSRMSIGSLLQLKADVQQLQQLNTPEGADEVYDYRWARNTAAVTQLLVG